MTFEHLKPLKHKSGTIIRMKSLVTIHGNQYVDCNDSGKRYPATELRELTPEELSEYNDQQTDYLIAIMEELS